MLLNEAGGIRDDLIIYDRGPEEVLTVINAACAEADTEWLRGQLEPRGIAISDHKGDGVLLALQGPEAPARLEALVGESLEGLPRFGHREFSLLGEGLGGEPAFVARTGYTGEDGFELLLSRDQGTALWDRLLAEGVAPCGLGARDTLRLEAAMHLYGNDMDATTTPLEASLGWLVHLEMPADFIGRAALERQTAAGLSKRLVGLKLAGRAIARHGYPVLHGGGRGGGGDQRHLVAHPRRSDRPGLRARRPRQARHGAGGGDPRPGPAGHRGEAALLPPGLTPWPPARHPAGAGASPPPRPERPSPWGATSATA